MTDICGDNRFEIIEKAKKHLIESTNISNSPDEMKVLDSFLFRCWQMGWLNEHPTVAYICDEKACEKCCNTYERICYRTTDIRHALNFKEVAPGKFYENIPELE